MTAYTKGTTLSGQGQAGGLAGHVTSGGSVNASYARGAVLSNTAVVNAGAAIAGGLAGYLGGSVTASYAHGSASAIYDASNSSPTGVVYAGGLAGQVAGSITASYSTGAATATGDATPAAGGLTGNSSGGTVTDSYWDTTTSGITATGHGTGKTTTELQAPTSETGIYANWDVNVDGVTGDDDPWDFGTASQYPVLDFGEHVVTKQRATVTITASPTTIWERAASALTPARVNASTITATLSGAWEQDVTVTPPAAVSGLYTLGSATISIAAGATVGTTTLAAVDDTVDQAGSPGSRSIPLSNTTIDTPAIGVTVTNAAITLNDDDNVSKTTGVRLSVDGTKIRADWTAAAGATGYRVEWNTADSGWGSIPAAQKASVTGGSATNYKIDPTPALSANTAYYVRVISTKTNELDAPPSDVVSATTRESAGTGDYDADNDGLIEVSNLAQLNAMRWDLDGDGAVDDNAKYDANGDGDYTDADEYDYTSNYQAAFPNAEANMGCNESVVSIASSNNTGNPACSGYELSGNLDFDTNNDGRTDVTGDTYWDGGKGWSPIAHESSSPDSSSHPFNTTFEGNNYVISNLFINRRGARTGSSHTRFRYELFAGLFGDVGSSAVIKNLGVEDVNITFKDYTTSIPDAPEVYAGGLVGYSEGEIFKTYVTGTVTAKSDGSTGTDKFPHAGGLIGRQVGGSITSSYARVTVTANFGGNDANLGSYAGGLVAYQDGGDIVATYARGSATALVRSLNGGKAHAGGLIGYHKGGEIKSSYSEADATASAYASDNAFGISPTLNAGGFVGTQDGGKITASYSVGMATSTITGTGTITTPTNNVGGLTGNHLSGMTDNSYWDTTVSGITATGQGTGKTTSELKTPTGYTGIYANWEFDLDDADNDDNDQTGKDNQWNFGTASDYPALQYHLTIPPQRASVTLSINPATIWESNTGGSTRVTSSTLTATLSGPWHNAVTVDAARERRVHAQHHDHDDREGRDHHDGDAHGGQQLPVRNVRLPVRQGQQDGEPDLHVRRPVGGR